MKTKIYRFLWLVLLAVFALLYLRDWIKGSPLPMPVFPSQSVENTYANINVLIPESDGEVSLPLIVRGEARVFEGTVRIRLQDGAGTTLLDAFTTAAGANAGEFAPFEFRSSYTRPATGEGTLEVFSQSAEDGSEINKLSLAIRFAPVQDMTVKAFFGNERLNPGAADCAAVFPVDRRIAQTKVPAKAALEELLRGLTITETNQGFLTLLPAGVEVEQLVIENGVASAAFTEALERGVGGSCRVIGMRAQITETLKQFPGVREVEISIDGRTEDILQP